MEKYTEKDAADYVKCLSELRKKEAKDGLRRDRKNGLMRDYSRPKYDGDPLVEEYRQLTKLRNGGKNNGGGGEDPVDPPETSRRPAQRTLFPWFGKRRSRKER